MESHISTHKYALYWTEWGWAVHAPYSQSHHFPMENLHTTELDHNGFLVLTRHGPCQAKPTRSTAVLVPAPDEETHIIKERYSNSLTQFTANQYVYKKG